MGQHSMDVDVDLYAPNQRVSRAPDLQPRATQSNQGKNVHLKGRRRFVADLEDMKDECKGGFETHGLRVTSECHWLSGCSLTHRDH